MSESEEIIKSTDDGRVYIVRKKTSPIFNFSNLFAGLFAYASALTIVYGLLSFNRPELISKAFENKAALVALLFGSGVALIAFAINMSALGRATFEKASGIERYKVPPLMSTFTQWALRAATGVEVSQVDESGGRVEKGKAKDELAGYKEDSFSYGAFSSNTPFEAHISNVLKSLSAYATSSEITATKLLDKGVSFMAGGLVFYVLAIAVWQIFANFTHPDPHVMYVGMAACSMTFVVVEFLAAWFFKQYRYYVEVSLSCLRVRSVYDRYLLSYYSLREFNSESDASIRNQMTESLKEDVNWPAYKGSVANDFNYMIESMGAAHTSMDKMKDLFQSKKKSKAEKV